MSSRPAPADCPFCALFQDLSLATTKVVQATRYDMVIEPLNPVTPGHLIVIPKQHITGFADNPAVFEAVAWAAANYVNGLPVRGDWNLITSMGPAATQTVEHLHIHLVPRRPGDGLELPWSVTEEDDRKPHGLQQAPHWPGPIPASVWCPTCDARQGVTGRFSSHPDDSLEGVRLACGHRVDPPFTT